MKNTPLGVINIYYFEKVR